MSNARQGTSCGIIFAALVIFVLLFQLFKGVATSNTQVPTVPDRSSLEHRYVQERFRQEGYNRSDSQQAADAIIKFQRAQEARR